MNERIHVTVRLFGPAIEMVGQNLLEYELLPPAGLGTLVELLCAKYPRLGENVSFLRFAVNQEYAERSHPLTDGDEVAVIPPVAGGQPDLVQLTHEPISAAELAVMIAHPSCGGAVTFEGLVRAEDASGNPLEALEYTAYDEMAMRLMNRIRDEARVQFPIREAAIAHRLGRLAIGECSVAIAVSSPHRAAAFDACRWIIDAVKKDVPIWKKEIWTRGDSSWVDPLAR